MLGRKRAAIAACAATTLYAVVAAADNPIVQTSYTADPAPMLHEGRLYLYTSHDEDVTVNDFFTMNDWRLYSTLDMVNWTDHGSVASYKTFSWGTGDAWAPHGIARNGKFYLYVPLNNATGSKIGVAVSNAPTGPFTDPLGKALIATGSGNIDPTVFIDDDGQAYLYWGNPDLYYVKLNEDMISFSGSPTKVALTTAGFGARSKTDRATAYEEGPWFYKRGSLYYLVYPADSTPEKLSYTTSSTPLGPWMYRGDVMAKQTGENASFTNHPGVIDFKGHSYLFYHNASAAGGSSYKRSVCVEELSYGADGSIPMLSMSREGPKAVANLNPFQRVEAETIAFSAGLKTETCSEGGLDVTSIDDGDYIKVKNVDFGSRATSVDVRVASQSAGGSIEFRLDSQTGTLAGTCAVSGTGGAQRWTTKTCSVSSATGVHDLFMKMVGGSGPLFNFDWWQFAGPGGVDAPTGEAGAGAGSGGSGSAGGPAENGGVAGYSPSGASGGGSVGGAGAPASLGGSGSSVAGTTSKSGSSTAGVGASAVDGGTAPSSSSGCSCRTAAAPGRCSASTTFTLFGLAGAWLRRSRRRA